MWQTSLPPAVGCIDLFLRGANADVAVLRVGDCGNRVAQGAPSQSSLQTRDVSGCSWSRTIANVGRQCPTKRKFETRVGAP